MRLPPTRLERRLDAELDVAASGFMAILAPPAIGPRRNGPGAAPKRRADGCPRVGVVPATRASLTSCSYGLTHARDRARSCGR